MPLAVAALVGAASYEPRVAEGTVLHRVVREHLESFLQEAACPGSSTGSSGSSSRAGRSPAAFARVHCRDCAYERLVPFSLVGDLHVRDAQPPDAALTGPHPHDPPLPGRDRATV